ncbi:hypothetical protein JXL19_09285 [bacterium]|nr:hypothetical protein [bacterium]
MRKICLLLLTAFWMFGCAGIMKVINGNGVPVPSPQPGLVLAINSSPGVWAECYIFEGRFREEELFIPHPSDRGKLTFPLSPVKSFVINPPPVDYFVHTIPILLSVAPADYTLLVFHKNMRGWVVETETIRFSTTGYAFNNNYQSGARKIFADRIVKLRHVNPYEQRQFRINRTFYPAHALKDFLGLP